MNTKKASSVLRHVPGFPALARFLLRNDPESMKRIRADVLDTVPFDELYNAIVRRSQKATQ